VLVAGLTPDMSRMELPNTLLTLCLLVHNLHPVQSVHSRKKKKAKGYISLALVENAAASLFCSSFFSTKGEGQVGEWCHAKIMTGKEAR
jgi:hypothetical protein